MSDFNFKIPFLGVILNYIYDFCTYKRNWTLRLLFENRNIKNDVHYFSIRCINLTSYNIQLTRVYIKEPKEKATLKIGEYIYKAGLCKTEYKNIEQKILTSNCANTYLSPTDTKEYRNYMMYDYENGIKNNEASIQIAFQGKKTELFVEYEIKDIKLSFFSRFFFDNRRIVIAIIPI